MTTAPPIYDMRPLGTAEELLAELSPVTGSLWRRREARYYFRGQANSANGDIWALRPTALRAAPPPFLRYQAAQVDYIPPHSALEQRQREFDTVFRFTGVADHQGTVIPGDTHNIRDFRCLMADEERYDFRAFPPPRLTPMFALAQHHGIPTRLLDWTIKPLVAAYFAVQEVARRREPGKPVASGEAPFSVFALQEITFGATLPLDPFVAAVRVPTATNANLHAQGGMFTVVQPREVDLHPLPDVTDVLRMHEAKLREAFEDRFPLLVEYRVPATQARATLRFIAQMGVHAASVFPNLGGVARAMEELRYHQRAEPGDRS